MLRNLDSLLERGWTVGIVQKLLGQPDAYALNADRVKREALYRTARVLKFESSPKFDQLLRTAVVGAHKNEHSTKNGPLSKKKQLVAKKLINFAFNPASLVPAGGLPEKNELIDEADYWYLHCRDDALPHRKRWRCLNPKAIRELQGALYGRELMYSTLFPIFRELNLDLNTENLLFLSDLADGALLAHYPFLMQVFENFGLFQVSGY